MKRIFSLLTPLIGLVGLVPAVCHAAPPAKAPSTSAYVHHVVVGAGGNICASDTTGTSTVLNNPLINGNPNAVVVATFNGGNSSSENVTTPAGVVWVFYDDANVCGNAANRWVLINHQNWQSSLTPLNDNASFNIFVAAP